MSRYNSIVPRENLTIYELLYNIEVGLREFVIEVLETKCGARWWRERLPSDVLGVYRKGREYEQSIKWCQLVPHHPIYYIDFPDLKKVIQRSDNWEDAFKSVFERKEVLISTLTELEPIRNKIAHNRKATVGDLHIVEAAYQKITAAISEKRFCELVLRCTSAEDLAESLLHLRGEAESAFICCNVYSPLERLEVWEGIQDKWWFDADYLVHELSAIEEYFGTLVAYSQLPRTRGYGHKIEAWVRSNDLEGKYAKAIRDFSALLHDIGGA